jgi:c-di-GMP-binding flagellar brake protein YcgR
MLPARVVHDGRGMVVALGAPPAPPQQRRNEVRGDLELRIRATQPPPEDNPELGYAVIPGRTRNISAGGMLATLDRGAGAILKPGTVITIDVELPEDDGTVEVRLNVIAVGNFGLRGSFIDLPRRDAERFARLVFTRERAQLAARRRRGEARSSGSGQVPGRSRDW